MFILGFRARLMFIHVGYPSIWLIFITLDFTGSYRCLIAADIKRGNCLRLLIIHSFIYICIL
jgi:hypothetical protein